MVNDISNYNLVSKHLNMVWNLCCWFGNEVKYTVKR